ncbi:hypothetical protein [Streptosporangium sp. NPDC020145]|uniref:hypothetical protein n=1 Tax=Streptosporangium sp. NPDC020145 TaxID=3154694 RepID=UPI003439D62B
MKVGYRTTAESLFASPIDQIAGQLKDQIREARASEVTSWKQSLPVLAQDLVEAGLGKVEMLIESEFVNRSRTDVVLTGVDHTGRDTYVAVELKRWGKANLCDDDPDRVRVPYLRNNPKHPLVQLRGYCDLLVALAGHLNGDPTRIGGVAYLHNAEEVAVADLFLWPSMSTPESSRRRHGGRFSNTSPAGSPRLLGTTPPTACWEVSRVRPCL